MHAPRPYGRFAEQAELSPEDAAAVERLARTVTNFKQLSALESLKRVADLPSGRQAVAIDMGGVFRILVLERHENPEHELTGLAETYVPMLFSGVVTRAQVLEGEGVGIKLTEQTRRRLTGYREDEDLPPKDVALQRFRIDYQDRFAYFRPEYSGIYMFTQYVKHRPTWYSGAMAEVAQVVGGYGRQVLADLPDDPIERARMRVPERYMREIRREVAGLRLPGYTGFPDREGQFQYTYQHGEGNAVCFDNSGKPWLLRINARGVFAMPLPLVPATTAAAFREYVEDVGDYELLKVLERFGGLPSGETFPEDEQDFEAWRRAGVFIKVCDCADFYTRQAFYAAGGWSFNSRGREGFNTCWDRDGAGLLRAHAYKMKLQLGAATNGGRLKASWQFSSDDETARAQGYLTRLFEQLRDGSHRARAIAYKVRRATASQILERVGVSNGSDKDYWDALELEPIATHQGNVARVGTGPVYWPGKNPKSMGRLKFPELRGLGCESFVMVSEDYAGPAVKCDTIVFGCYVDDELQVVKYFYDERKLQEKEQSTFEKYMIVGQWEKTVTTGLSGLMGYFYTSSFDDRQVAPPVSTTTHITGTDMGYGQPAFATPPILYCVGSLSRARYYMHRTKVKSTSGFGIDVAACVPVFERDCILYPYTDSTSGRSESDKTEQFAMADPTSYQLWCYDNLFHWMGQTDNHNKGDPPSKDGVPVYIDTLVYSPTEVSDYADSGNWYNLPPGGFMDITAICGPYTSRSSGTQHANGVVIGGEAPGFEPFSSQTEYPAEQSGRLSVSMKGAGSVVAHREIPHSWYFGFSPEDQTYFYRDAVHVAIGDSGYASIYEQDQNGLRRRWGYTALADNRSAHHFIGVINE
ncbi:hypothetical protein [uncultured Variovorax sp.]|uniref:hypothetical protein n=1 Tax=uncultured Variovorax sp. TaxID=114708 RepID=UPI0025CE29C3|nr:hypothetical protein [uncultured Variovorax sp.]